MADRINEALDVTREAVAPLLDDWLPLLPDREEPEP